jgi:acetolactate synthase small subunit
MPATDSRSDPTYCFSVFAAAEASVMPRVLELFAKRGLVPSRFDAAVSGADLSIDVQVDGMEAHTASHIAACLRNVVHVGRVLTAVKSHAAEAS